MWNKILWAVLVFGAIAVTGSVALSDEDEASGAAIAKYLPSAKVTLQQGLTAAESQGQPISGKFEIDEGHFQLSVYTAEGGKFSEVLVDYSTGKVARSEAITGGDDLKEAKEQVAAMGKAKKSLKALVDQAERERAGYRAIGVEAEVKNGHAVAVVRLLKGTEVKSVSEPLE